MKSARPYILVDNCLEVIEFYRNILNGLIQNVEESEDGKCLHAELVVGNNVIHFSDAFEHTKQGDNGRIYLEFESEEDIKRAYQSLIVDGKITEELQDTQGTLQAKLVDQFGVSWVLRHEMYT